MTWAEYKRTTLAQMQTRRYRTIHRLENGYVSIPPDTEVTVTGKHGGLSVQGKECSCCGVAVRVSKVSPYSLVRIDDDA